MRNSLFGSLSRDKVLKDVKPLIGRVLNVTPTSVSVVQETDSLSDLNWRSTRLRSRVAAGIELDDMSATFKVPPTVEQSFGAFAVALDDIVSSSDMVESSVDSDMNVGSDTTTNTDTVESSVN